MKLNEHEKILIPVCDKLISCCISYKYVKSAFYLVPLISDINKVEDHITFLHIGTTDIGIHRGQNRLFYGKYLNFSNS